MFVTNISKMNDENSGQLNYDKLPFFLLGDAFSIFKRPYFMIIDNYLILANSPTASWQAITTAISTVNF